MEYGEIRYYQRPDNYKYEDQFNDGTLYGLSEYKKGDIVVWRGEHPCICIIKSKISYSGLKDRPNYHYTVYKDRPNYHFIYKEDVHLSYRNLRPATEAEKILLGRKNIFPLDDFNEAVKIDESYNPLAELEKLFSGLLDIGIEIKESQINQSLIDEDYLKTAELTKQKQNLENLKKQ